MPNIDENKKCSPSTQQEIIHRSHDQSAVSDGRKVITAISNITVGIQHSRGTTETNALCSAANTNSPTSKSSSRRKHYTNHESSPRHQKTTPVNAYSNVSSSQSDTGNSSSSVQHKHRESNNISSIKSESFSHTSESDSTPSYSHVSHTNTLTHEASETLTKSCSGCGKTRHSDKYDSNNAESAQLYRIIANLRKKCDTMKLDHAKELRDAKSKYEETFSSLREKLNSVKQNQSASEELIEELQAKLNSKEEKQIELLRIQFGHTERCLIEELKASEKKIEKLEKTNKEKEQIIEELNKKLIGLNKESIQSSLNHENQKLKMSILEKDSTINMLHKELDRERGTLKQREISYKHHLKQIEREADSRNVDANKFRRESLSLKDQLDKANVERTEREKEASDQEKLLRTIIGEKDKNIQELQQIVHGRERRIAQLEHKLQERESELLEQIKTLKENCNQMNDSMRLAKRKSIDQIQTLKERLAKSESSQQIRVDHVARNSELLVQIQSLQSEKDSLTAQLESMHKRINVESTISIEKYANVERDNELEKKTKENKELRSVIDENNKSLEKTQQEVEYFKALSTTLQNELEELKAIQERSINAISETRQHIVQESDSDYSEIDGKFTVTAKYASSALIQPFNVKFDKDNAIVYIGPNKTTK